MDKESVKNIYPVLAALAGGTDTSVCTAIEILNESDSKVLAEEAETILIMLNAYKKG